MLAVVGTVPDDSFPLTAGPAELRGEVLSIKGREVDVNRGTPALLAAACRTAEFTGSGRVYAYLVGDTGLGRGSRLLYEHITGDLARTAPTTITFHYLQPDVDWHNKVLFAAQAVEPRPLLIADAGFMYAAKMSGLASSYDLFTPDVGELAFLADETAPHPFYTRGFILHEEDKAGELVARAYANDNAAAALLVKGRTDLVAVGGEIVESVDSPVVEAMEAIGGTGDTLTGMVGALMDAGLSVSRAALLAARTNRLAGDLAGLCPASQIIELIKRIPEALDAFPAEEWNERRSNIKGR